MSFSTILIVLSLLFFDAATALAQSDVKIERNPNGYSLLLATPQPGSSYSWEVPGGPSGSGLTFEAPFGSQVVLYRDGAEANRLAFTETGACADWAVFSHYFGDACNGCTVSFRATGGNALSHSWNFGDGTFSNESSPTHTYLTPGTYTVVHTVIVYDDLTGGFLSYTCSQQVTVNCGGTQVKERVECCKLLLDLCSNSGTAGCSHLWEILNSSGTVCLSSTDPNPTFVLENINTYVNGTVTVRHTTNCGGISNVETFNHTIQSQGIYVGDGVDPTSPVPFPTATGLLNNNQPLFPSLTVSGQNVYVDCVLEIGGLPAGTQVQLINDQVCFAADAGLNTRMYTAITGSVLYNGCPQAWRGISARSGPSYTLSLSSSTLRGAVFAVHHEWNKASINLTNSQLRSNFIGLYSETPIDGHLLIRGNTFTSGPLPALGATSIQAVSSVTGGYSQTGSFAGIFVRNIPDVNIESTHSGNPNIFFGGANGVYLENTRASVRYCTFNSQNTNPAYLLDNTGHGVLMRHTGIKAELIADYSTYSVGKSARGIRVVSKMLGTFIKINNNSIGAGIGVALEQLAAGRFVNTVVRNNIFGTRGAGVKFSCEPTPNISSVIVRDNNITALEGDGILFTGPNPGSKNIQALHNTILVHHTQGISGIHLLNFSNALVAEQNSISFPNLAIRPTRGIWLENSRNSLIQSNTLTSTYTAGYTVNNNNGIHLANSPNNEVANNLCQNTPRGLFLFGDCTMPERLRCNTLKGTGFGMLYSDMSITGNQTNTGNHWDDNQFLPGGGLIGAAHQGDQTFVGLSPFRTLQGTSIQYPKSFQMQPGVAPSTWFYLGQDAQCDPPPPYEPTEAELLAATAGIPVGNGYEEGFNWMARRYLYRKLQENPGLAGSVAVYQAFLNAAASNAIGAYELLRENAQAAGALDAATEQQVQALSADADAALAEMHDILAEIESQNPSGAALEQLLQDYAAAVADLEAAHAQIGQLLAPFQLAVAQNAAQAVATNAALPAVETWEQREKTLNALTYKSRDGHWLTGADRGYILETAAMCPWEAGMATYQARALWLALTGEVLDEPECPPVAQRTDAPDAAVASDLFLFPNPAANQFQLRLSGETAERNDLRYQLHNALGTLVQEGRVAGAAADISVEALPTGLYTCRVLQGAALLHAAKVTVIRR